MEDGLVGPVDEGTPQGGPLSPLLSNLVLDDLDKELTRRGHRFCRYADDCNIYVRSRRAGERGDGLDEPFLTQKLRLKGHEAKSAVARPEERKFLGFSISNDGSERRIAPKALDKFKTRVRDKTRRDTGDQPTAADRRPDAIPHLDGAATSASARPHVCSRTSKRGSAEDYARISGGSGRTGTTASTNCAGVAYRSSVQRSPPVHRRVLAHVRTPGGQQALRNHYFDSLGLPRLHVSAPA